MRCELTVAAAFLRLFAPGQSHGDPYLWCCGVSVDPAEPRVAILGPNMAAPPPGSIPAIAAALHAHGFTHARWGRGTGKAERVFEVAPFLG
jgi:hypothetical protein